MMDASLSHVATWSIATAAVFGVIIRPRDLPEAVWAVLGAGALVAFSLLPVSAAVAAVVKGTDVYLFLIGMMILAELARREGLFDWLAAYAVNHAAGSTTRLFILVYGVGTVVTIFLSNDATAVVLTPAVYAAARRAGAPPLPYLLICAFIANAASFVLPISNPANLVVFGSQMPTLWRWFTEFGIASAVSIISTYAILYLTQRQHLSGNIAGRVSQPSLAGSAWIVAGAIVLTAIALLVASTLGWQLGLPTFLAGVVAWIAVSAIKRDSPWKMLARVSWSVLPLVAGLFVLVAGVEHTGVLHGVSEILLTGARQSPHQTALLAGAAVAFVCNAVNNLPMGLLAGTLAQSAHLPGLVTGAVLIGVDLGPNLSVTGSLATILWLVAIRREGEDVSAWKFLAVGSLVMPLPLFAALGSFVVNRF